MKIEEYGYIVSNIGKYASDSSNYQDFSSYPLRCGLPKLQAENVALHYAISMHGNQYIVVKENNMSIHVITNMLSKEASFPSYPKAFIAPFFIEKTKAYQTSNHSAYIFTMLYQKIDRINKSFDIGWANHPYRELEAYCKKHFGFLEWGARTEIEAGR